MQNFRTYQLAVAFYRSAKGINLPAHLKDQLLRAASSICLNLSEGYGRLKGKDQLRFYRMAFGSIRECQSITHIEEEAFSALVLESLDLLAASAFRLIERGAVA